MIKVAVIGGKMRERGRMGKKMTGVRAVYFVNFFVLFFQKPIYNICWKVNRDIFGNVCPITILVLDTYLFIFHI